MSEPMEVKSALKEQYHAGLAMLAECVEKCPDDLWTHPNPRNGDGDRVIYRAFWRIALHTAYFTHLYLGQNEEALKAPPEATAIRQRQDLEAMWHAPWDIEPYELTEDAPESAKIEVKEYVSYVDSLVDATLDGLDLDSDESGFPWYKNINKLSHQLLNLRHLQGHVGQLSELLMAKGIDIKWVSKGG